jgi:hypothetical protein
MGASLVSFYTSRIMTKEVRERSEKGRVKLREETCTREERNRWMVKDKNTIYMRV